MCIVVFAAIDSTIFLNIAHRTLSHARGAEMNNHIPIHQNLEEVDLHLRAARRCCNRQVRALKVFRVLRHRIEDALSIANIDTTLEIGTISLNIHIRHRRHATHLLREAALLRQRIAYNFLEN
jgi:hypothetical protein